jgi:hypothetical protein
MRLYHFTCEHGHAALGDRGIVKPPGEHSPREMAELPREAWLMAKVAWFTDLDVALTAALGLTTETIYCDRTAYRYRVLDNRDVVRWVYSHWHRDPFARRLDATPGAMPMHWWVSSEWVEVVLDPM